MESNKKILLTTIAIAILVVLVSGVTFAFFNYARTGVSNVLKVGRIYFNTSQNGNINLTNVFPITSEELENDTNNHDSVEITITGDTTYSGGIEYLVSLVNVNNTVNNKKIPVKFNIEEENIGTSNDNYYTSRGGNTSIYSISNSGEIREGKYMLAGYIAPGQTGIDGTIEITAFVDKDKIAITDTYSTLEPNYAPDPNMSNDALNYCINYFTQLWGQEQEGQTVRPGETYEAFCRGTGTNWGYTFIYELNNDYFNSSEIDAFVNNGILIDTNPYVGDTTDEWINGRTVFTTDEWNSFKNNNAISFKIKVEANEGIWVEEPERDDATPSTCFEKKAIKTYTINSNMTQTELNDCNTYMTNKYGKNSLNHNMTQTELNDCINYITSLNWGWDPGETPEAYCNGSGTRWESTFQELLDNNNFSQENLDYFSNHNIIVGDYINYCRGETIIKYGNFQKTLDYDYYNNNFDYSYLEEHNIVNKEEGIELKNFDSSCGTDIIIPNKMDYVRMIYNSNISLEEVNTCVNYLTQIWGIEEENHVNDGETYQKFCTGTGTLWNRNFQKMLDDEWFNNEQLTFLKNNNIINEQSNNYKVLSIGDNFYSGSISTLVFNKSLIRIRNDAFSVGSNATIPSEIIIPASVRHISTQAFKFFHNVNDTNYYANKSFRIEGKPYISGYSIPAYETISYNGTCQELYSYNDYIPGLIYDDNGGDDIFNIITTDTNTCSVGGGYA